MSFPERLKEARNAVGYTQQQVADAMGITNSTYCGYETGKRRPDVAKIKRLADILKTSGDFLLETGFIQLESGAVPADGALSPKEVSLPDFSNIYEQLSPRYKKIVADLALQLLSAQEEDQKR